MTADSAATEAVDKRRMTSLQGDGSKEIQQKNKEYRPAGLAHTGAIKAPVNHRICDKWITWGLRSYESEPKREYPLWVTNRHVRCKLECLLHAQ
jgi:hypothetical protein